MKQKYIDEIVERICQMIKTGDTQIDTQNKKEYGFEKAFTKSEGTQLYREASNDKYRMYICNLLDGLLDENGDYIAYDGTKVYVSPEDKVTIIERIFGAYRGLGVLEPILLDEEITEIMINGPKNIFIEKKGSIMRLEQQIGNDETGDAEIRKIIHRIVDMCGREVNESKPIVDARLTDGSRVNIVLSPIAMNGDTITIRKFSKKPMDIERLIAYGSITREIANILQKLVRAKYNIFISGGTGSGKTTFLNALSNYIPSDERVITIEDSAELQINGINNLVSLETKQANAEGKGAITIKDLIKSSLRMRPDRIVVGEVRGEEALDMLQAMNTGHDGSLSTGHSNSAKDMLSRLETMVLQGASGLPLDAVKQQIGSALDLIVHLSRMRDHSRKVVEITEVIGCKNGEIILNPLYKFEEDEKSTFEKVSGSLIRTENKMKKDYKLKLAGIKEVII